MFYTEEVDDEAIATLEHFAVSLYDFTGDMDNNDEVHQHSSNPESLHKAAHVNGISISTLPPLQCDTICYHL